MARRGEKKRGACERALGKSRAPADLSQDRRRLSGPEVIIFLQTVLLVSTLLT
jgi:hypothetical protein